MNWRTQFQTLAAAMVLFGAASNSLAVPYASFVNNTGGDMWEFVLNEDADEVTVLRDGANPVNLGTTAGRYNFDMTGFSTFEIEVSKSAPVGWTTISDDTNMYTRYERPNGLVVNNDPSHPLFGTVYVLNGTNLTAAGVNGRPTGDGVYALTSDMIGVDLPTKLALTDPTDTSAAKAPGWKVDNPTHPGTPPDPPTPLQLAENLSAWRLALDDSGNLIASDWSDINGGVNWASADLTTGGRLLGRGYDINGVPTPDNTPTGPTGGVFGVEEDDLGRIPLHGSIVSKPYVTGTVGVDLTLWAMDEDLDVDLSHPGNDGNSIWRWDVGSATDFDAMAPELVINVGEIEATSDSRSNFLNLNVGVLANAHYSPEHDKWYLTQNRSNGGEAGLIVLTPGEEGASTLEWSSFQFSIDNALDGFTDFPATPSGTSTDIQDAFRSMGGGITLSPDGTKLLVQRVATSTTNPILGPDSNLPGAVLIIPLDENGIPNLEVSDSEITNMDSITTISNTANGSRREVVVDLAGNVYTTNNVSELLQVFSPGGSFMAVTSSDGTFALTPIEGGLDGDHNGDGFVNAADYVFWRDFLGDGQGYQDWRDNFGASAGSGTGAAVPEPASIIAMLTCLAGMLILRRPFGLQKRSM